MQRSSTSSPTRSTENKKIKRRKQNNEDWKDEEDPERRRLKGAQLVASQIFFLPHPKSIGAGRFTLSKGDANALKALFSLVVAKTKSRGVTWGEGPDDHDPRRRMYGFLPGQREALVKAGIRIQKYGAEGDQEHEDALQSASVDLSFGKSSREAASSNTAALVLDGCVYRVALEAVTRRVHSMVPDRYKPYATMSQLIAVQPNLHNGASYLPAHLDFPLNDGFGVLIVTIGIKGSGTIVLIDDGDDNDEDSAKSFCFPLKEGEAYILCGDSRNKCVHGVLCDDDDGQRETLNLRYGLHSKDLAYEEIDRHWPN